jgi:DNA processing protein
MTDPEAYRSWLILNMLPDIGRTLFGRLVTRFGSADAVLGASDAELQEVGGIGPMATRSIRNWRELVDVEAEMRLVEQHGVSLTCLSDDDYPANLRTMAAPPPLLYYRGTLAPIDQAAVAVIGSRKLSCYGREATQTIARDLAQAGVTVVSGLAMGGDAVAHQAALEGGGRTLAVLGNGLATVYPACNKRLAQEISDHGALISEMHLEAGPDPGSFPQRNAIIAGLSLGVLVAEAGPKSGTRITADRALDDNRAVFAVPGDITRVNSVGTNQLIKEGARLVTCARDILVDLRPQLQGLIDGLPDLADADPAETPPLPHDLSDAEAKVYQALELDPMSIEAVGEALGDVPVGEQMSALLSLELRGLIRQEPGKRFRRVR